MFTAVNKEKKSKRLFEIPATALDQHKSEFHLLPPLFPRSNGENTISINRSEIPGSPWICSSKGGTSQSLMESGVSPREPWRALESPTSSQLSRIIGDLERRSVGTLTPTAQITSNQRSPTGKYSATGSISPHSSSLGIMCKSYYPNVVCWYAYPSRIARCRMRLHFRVPHDSCSTSTHAVDIRRRLADVRSTWLWDRPSHGRNSSALEKKGETRDSLPYCQLLVVVYMHRVVIPSSLVIL